MEKSIHIPLESLVVPPLAVRVKVDEEKILELAETAKTHGVIEPLVVRPSKAEAGKYEVVCGLRRFLAAQKAGLPDVPCIVKEMSDVEAMEAMIVENLQREDLTDYEVGRWFKLLMEKFPDKYPNLQTVAKRFGYKSHVMVSYLVSHYESIESLKQKLPPNIVTRVTMLPEAMIREIRRAPEDLQPKLVRIVCKKLEECERGEDKDKPSVRDVAMLVDSYTMKWERKTAVEAEKPEGAKPEKPEKPEAEKPEVVGAPPKLEEAEKPKPLSKPEVPSEEEVEKRLAEIRRRREAERKQRLSAILYTYYPQRFLEDLAKVFDFGAADEEKALMFTNYVIEVTWNEKLSDTDKVEVVQKAQSLMQRRTLL